ncbi:hypothetical protein LOTGIDRAFT_212502 [Lottia gigantea]|uniref:SH3 domain-containing protein n=1 Tax=Lottia gigantea TaxID=225164 RepID=V4CL49_LOTGI|nr:hypothetical protein LOTGIDRAFT_212502 [Lottia gigantea]ESP02990.1 hypothetical protein LOTGIDRAFT_212502 [Lottia gigantea]
MMSLFLLEGVVIVENSEEEVPYTENIRVTPAASLNQPLKSGWLEKRRKGLIGKISYQKRYCVIHSAALYYYEKPTDKKQNGAFPLNGYEFREAPQLVSGAKKELSFELVGPGKRTYEFLAENKEEFNSWREAVESCHNEPISEELYEAIEDIIRPAPPRGQPPATPIVDDGEEYEIPQVEQQETYEVVGEDQPPILPAPRKVSTQSVPKMAPPSIPNVPLPEPPVQPQTPKKRVPKLIGMTNDPAEDFENMYFGKWDCSTDTDNELKFNKGDIIHIISKDFDSENWWVGEYKGSIGLVPKSYLAKAYELMP